MTIRVYYYSGILLFGYITIRVYYYSGILLFGYMTNHKYNIHHMLYLQENI